MLVLKNISFSERSFNAVHISFTSDTIFVVPFRRIFFIDDRVSCSSPQCLFCIGYFCFEKSLNSLFFPQIFWFNLSLDIKPKEKSVEDHSVGSINFHEFTTLFDARVLGVALSSPPPPPLYCFEIINYFVFCIN